MAGPLKKEFFAAPLSGAAFMSKKERTGVVDLIKSFKETVTLFLAQKIAQSICMLYVGVIFYVISFDLGSKK